MEMLIVLLKFLLQTKVRSKKSKMAEGGKGADDAAYFSSLLDEIDRGNHISMMNTTSPNDTSI